MRTARRELAVALVVLAAAGSTATAEVVRQVRPTVVAASYFPLQPGNHWVYEKQRPAGPTTWEVTVTEAGVSAPQRLYETITGYFSGARQVRVVKAHALMPYIQGDAGLGMGDRPTDHRHAGPVFH